MGTVRFIIRKHQIDKKGKAPIDMVYSVQGQRKFYRTKVKIHPANWDEDSQQSISIDRGTAKVLAPGFDYDKLLSAKEARDTNLKLASNEHYIRDIENRLEANGIVYSSEMVKNLLLEKKTEKVLTKKEAKGDAILEFLDGYIETNPNNYSNGSLNLYRQLKQHLTDFKSKKSINLKFEETDLTFMETFQKFLTADKPKGRKLLNITAAKQINILKSLLSYAKLKKEKVNQEYKDFKVFKVKDTDVIVLTESEMMALWNLKLIPNSRLDKVRDIFVLACQTGLRYSDLKQLGWEHIQPNEIILTTIKTTDTLTVPLTPISKLILTKYKGRHRPLPMMSSQKINETLQGWETDNKSSENTFFKGLGELAGINTPTEKVRVRGTERIVTVNPKFKLLSIHMGRRTYVTLNSEKSVPIQVIMAATGHKTFKSVSRYLKVTNQSLHSEMNKAWGTVEPKPTSSIVEEGNTFEIIKR